MTHKVSIAISGAVSLGSYEAGTVYEIIHAIQLHNDANPDNRIEIDVLSGASAGGMTAAVIAQKLLFDRKALEDPVDNVLYDIWVNRVDIDDLLDPDLGDDPSQSLLSTNRVKANAERAFLRRYQQKARVALPHNAIGKNIKLGLALSNLNGVDYELPTFSSHEEGGLEQGEFVQTRNQDRFTTDVTQSSDTAAFWLKVIDVGLACGAFPVAFRAMNVQREWTSRDYRGRGAKNWQDIFHGNFSYTDGGIFNNYPLGMARDLSLWQDSEVEDTTDRFYFYISPNAKSSNTDYTFNAHNANMVQSLGQVFKSILSNSRFQDWVEIDQMQDELNTLHERAQSLLVIISELDKQEFEAIKTATQHFCKLLYSEQEHKDQKDYFEDYYHAEKTFSCYASPIQKFTEERKKVWLDALLIMQINAPSRNKDRMTIYTITAESDELASTPIGAFFGFLDERFRHHDYLMGRLKARTMINDIIASVKAGSNQLPLNIEPLDTTSLQVELDQIAHLRNANIEDVDINTRNKLYLRLKDRSHRIMKSIGIHSVVRWFVFCFVLRGQLKKFLKI